MRIINDNTMTFGTLLNAFRKRTHLTQQQLAEAIGMHRHAISRWEQGEVLPSSKAIVLELARYLHLDEQETRRLLDESMTAPVHFWGVPAPRNLLFTGRKKTFELLHAHLHVDKVNVSPQIVALCGLGGIGKTQTALEYAYRYALEYRAIFWIEAETMERVLFSWQRIAELLQLPEHSLTDQQRVVEAVQRWLSSHDQWLLIWDNVEDLTLLHRFLSLTRQGAFLLTTRRQALGTFAWGLDVSPMEPEESAVLLLRRAKLLEAKTATEAVPQLSKRDPSECAVVTKLVTILGGLPLALDQAGAYIEETGCSLVDYLHYYEQQQGDLLSRRGNFTSDHVHSVTATFRLSQERVEHEQIGAAGLLRLCAFLHAEDIPEDLFHLNAEQAGDFGPVLASLMSDPMHFDLALAALRNLSLVQRSVLTHTLSLHRLVQVVIREQMDAAEVRLWSERVIRLVNAAFPKVTFSTWADCERLLVHALVCVPLIELVGQALPASGELLEKTGRYLLERGRIDEAEPLLRKAVSLGELEDGFDHPKLIPRLANLGELFWRQGKYASAETLLSRTLALEERHLEANHLLTADTVNTLAVIYLDQGKYDQAEPFFRRALHMWELHNHSDKNAGLNNLALLYSRQGKYAQAEPLYQQALDVCKQMLGPEHPEVSFALGNLAVLYRDQGQHRRAEPLFQQAISIQERATGPGHPNLAFWLNGLAILYREQGKYEQAELLFQRTRDIREGALGPEHPLVAGLLSNLAVLYREQGKYEQAESLFQQALHIQEQRVGAAHPEVAFSLINLAILYRDQNKYEQAEQLFQRGMGIQERILGPEHPERANSLNGLATLYAMQGKYEQAEQLFRYALRIYERALGPERPHGASSLHGLALVYHKQGKYEQAEKFLRRALQIRERTIGLEHPDTIRTLNELTSLANVKEACGQAEVLFQHILQVEGQIIGPEHL